MKRAFAKTMPQSSSSGFRETAVLVEVFRQLIANGDDVFLIRQRGREIAAAIGFDDADQVRIATALSEVGRDALAGGTATAVFEIDPETNRFVIGVDGFPKSLATDSPGIVSAKRLMFAVAIVFDVPKAPRSELWAPTLSEKFKPGPPLARVHARVVAARRND